MVCQPQSTEPANNGWWDARGTRYKLCLSSMHLRSTDFRGMTELNSVQMAQVRIFISLGDKHNSSNKSSADRSQLYNGNPQRFLHEDASQRDADPPAP